MSERPMPAISNAFWPVRRMAGLEWKSCRSSGCHRSAASAQPQGVVPQRSAVASPERILEQRIYVDRPVQAVAAFVFGHPVARIADPLRRRQGLVLGVLPVVEAQPLGRPLHRRAQELATD